MPESIYLDPESDAIIPQEVLTLFQQATKTHGLEEKLDTTDVNPYLKRRLHTKHPDQIKQLATARLQKFKDAALLIIEHDPYHVHAQKAKEQISNYQLDSSKATFSLDDYQKFVTQGVGELIDILANLFGVTGDQMQEYLTRAERYVNTKTPVITQHQVSSSEAGISLDTPKTLTVYKISVPKCLLTEAQIKEYLSIFANSESYKPAWYKILPTWEKRALAQRLLLQFNKEHVEQFKAGLTKEAMQAFVIDEKIRKKISLEMGFIASSLRHLPGIANAWDEFELIYDQDILIDQTRIQRASIAPPIDLIAKIPETELDRLTQQNIQQMMPEPLTQEHKEAFHQIWFKDHPTNTNKVKSIRLYQTLVSPGKIDQIVFGSGFSGKLLAFFLPEMIRHALSIQPQPKSETHFVETKEHAVTQLNKQSSSQTEETVTTNHAINQLRIFTWSLGTSFNSASRKILTIAAHNVALILATHTEEVFKELLQNYPTGLAAKDLDTQLTTLAQNPEKLLRWAHDNLDRITTALTVPQQQQQLRLLIQATRDYISLCKNSNADCITWLFGNKRKHDHNAAMYRSALELIIVEQSGCTTATSCKSSKDRLMAVLVMKAAMRQFYHLTNRLPRYGNQQDRKILVHLYVKEYLTQHHKFLAEQNADGSFGLKSLHRFLPKDILDEINRQSNNDDLTYEKHNSASSATETPKKLKPKQPDWRQQSPMPLQRLIPGPKKPKNKLPLETKANKAFAKTNKVKKPKFTCKTAKKNPELKQTKLFLLLTAIEAELKNVGVIFPTLSGQTVTKNKAIQLALQAAVHYVTQQAANASTTELNDQVFTEQVWHTTQQQRLFKLTKTGKEQTLSELVSEQAMTRINNIIKVK